MDGLTKCHRTALREVLGAVGLLKSRVGASLREIYFVLDHLHGRVQRPVINYALKTAVDQGLLNRVNNCYKLRRRQGAGTRLRTGLRSRSGTSRTRQSSHLWRGTQTQVTNTRSPSQRTRSSRAVRGRVYRVRRRSVSSVESCSCDDCSEYSVSDLSSTLSDRSQYSPKPRPKKRVRKTTKRYPMPKKIKVERKSSAMSETKNDRKSTRSTTRKRQSKARGFQRSTSVKERKEIQSEVEAALLVPEEEPTHSRAEPSSKYNLRPRKTTCDQNSTTLKKLLKENSDLKETEN